MERDPSLSGEEGIGLDDDDGQNFDLQILDDFEGT